MELIGRTQTHKGEAEEALSAFTTMQVVGQQSVLSPIADERWVDFRLDFRFLPKPASCPNSALKGKRRANFGSWETQIGACCGPSWVLSTPDPVPGFEGAETGIFGQILRYMARIAIMRALS